MEITDRQCSRSQYAWFKWWCHLFWPHFAGAWAPSRGRQPQWTLSDTTDTHPSFQMITKEFEFSGFIGMVHHPESVFFFFFGGINCAFYLSIWVYGCMDWVTRIWATQGKRFSLCFLRKAVEEGWGVESKTGKKEGTWERRCEGTTYWMNKWIKEDVYRQLFRDEKRECECLGCIKTEICYRLQFETWYLINARPNTSRFCFFVFFSDSF